MDDASRAAVTDGLVRGSDAIRDSIEIVRERQTGDRVTTLARWTDARTGRKRRGAVDAVLTEGVWRAAAGWSIDADHDADHPVWQAWGSSSRSLSGWVADPAVAAIQVRDPNGRVETDTVENGVAIVVHDAGFDRDSVVEALDADGTVLHTAPLT